MSETMETLAPDTRHNRATRLLHAGLALGVVAQLLTSLVMEGPDDEQPGNLLFQIHRYCGLVVTGLALGLWLTVLLRSRGTELGALFPWFSGRRLAALWQDCKVQLRAALTLRFADHGQQSALPSAVHGLGLLLVTTMAVSGTIYFVQVALGLHSAEPDGMAAMAVHQTLANLVWVYLIAHAGMAILLHVLRALPLSVMWSLGRRG